MIFQGDQRFVSLENIFSKVIWYNFESYFNENYFRPIPRASSGWKTKRSGLSIKNWFQLTKKTTQLTNPSNVLKDMPLGWIWSQFKKLCSTDYGRLTWRSLEAFKNENRIMLMIVSEAQASIITINSYQRSAFSLSFILVLKGEYFLKWRTVLYFFSKLVKDFDIISH